MFIQTVEEDRKICVDWLGTANLENRVQLGLPEIDDRYNCWRVVIQSENSAKYFELIQDSLGIEHT